MVHLVEFVQNQISNLCFELSGGRKWRSYLQDGVCGEHGSGHGGGKGESVCEWNESFGQNCWQSFLLNKDMFVRRRSVSLYDLSFVQVAAQVGHAAVGLYQTLQEKNSWREMAWKWDHSG